MIIFSERTSLRTWSKEPSRGESETGVSSYTESLYWPATVPAASCLPEGEVLSSIQHMLPEQWIPYEIPGRTLSEITVTLYVCNGCREENRCTLRKQFYVHDTAEKSYRKMLVCSRTGASITEAERLFLSERIDQGIQKGQSFHHILASDADQITVGKKTVYRYINAGLLRTKRGDMPRSCWNL